MLTTMIRPFNGKRPSTPLDLRESGSPDDPAFQRPLVYGRIDTGIVEIRRPGSDVVERNEVSFNMRSGREVQTMTVTARKQKAKTVDNDAADAADIPELTRRVAELYNAGATWKEMMRELNKPSSTISRHTKKARELGLITNLRSGSDRFTIQPGLKNVLDRLNSLERQIQSLETQLKDTNDTNAAAIERIRNEIDIFSSGLVELTRRIEALEARMADVTLTSKAHKETGGEMAQRLLRLLELVLAGEARRTA